MDILPQLVLNSIIAGAIYAMVALGFNLIYGATKFFNLTHGVIAVIGAYGFLFFGKTLAWLYFIFKRFYRRRYGGDCRVTGWTN